MRRLFKKDFDKTLNEIGDLLLEHSPISRLVSEIHTCRWMAGTRRKKLTAPLGSFLRRHYPIHYDISYRTWVDMHA